MKNKGLFVLVLILSLILAEIGLRIFLPSKKYIFPPGLKYTFTPDSEIIKGVDSISVFTVNTNGLRGSDFESAYTNILVLGGSTTECLYIDDQKCWTSLLEKKLNAENLKVKIGSGGKSSRTSYEHLAEIKIYTEQYPLISHVILMNGLNDFLKTLSQKSFNNENENLSCIIDSISEVIFTRSYSQKSPLLFQLLRNSFLKHKNANIQDPKGRIYQKWILNRNNNNPKIDTLPDLRIALLLFRKRQEAIINYCNQKKINLTFIEQSANWTLTNDSIREKEFWMGGIGNFQQNPTSTYYSQFALRKGLVEYNKEIEQLCKENNIDFIKTDSILSLNPSNFYDDCHFTNSGSVELSLIIFKQILNKIKK